ncbi:hypothetical protein BBJ28_00003843 [Nothophytophthora sp. Chile5]|nr:hypothetical protein BBJ28_00003843 [Nothophytophthora sp. Chile5]
MLTLFIHSRCRYSAIDNPDERSELALLTAYAPNVPVDILRRLCRAFAELRLLVEEGTITYPYSTREAVAVAKHLEQFPEDGVTSVLENVLAFDAYDRNMRTQLSEVFLSLAESRTLPEFVPTETWGWRADQSVKFSAVGGKGEHHVHHSALSRREIWLDPSTTRSFAVQQHRLQQFTEQVSSFQVPLKGNRKQKAHAMAAFPDSSVHGARRLHPVYRFETLHPSLLDGLNLGRSHSLLIAVGLTIFLSPLTNSDGRAACLTLPDGALDGRLHHDPSTSHGKKPKKAKQSPFTKWFGNGGSGGWRAEADAANDGLVLRYLQGGSMLQLLDLNTNRFFSLDLASLATPVNEILTVQSIGNREWLVRTTDPTVLFSLKHEQGEDVFVLKAASVQSVPGSSPSSGDSRHSIFPIRHRVQGGQEGGAASMMVHPQAFLQLLTDDTSNGSILSALREDPDDVMAQRNVQWAWQNDEVLVNSVRSEATDCVDLEVTSPTLLTTKNVVVDALSAAENDSGGLFSAGDTPSVPRVVAVADVHGGNHTLTLQEDGAVRVWQLNQTALDRESELWRQMFGREVAEGSADSRLLELRVDGARVGGPSTPKTGLDAPKYGKDDPNNDPHVGGNTWAGGTGGSDTAGLGGRGGPYRLDKGHPVHQVSQAKKDEVSTEARAKARAMAEEALAEKLREIDMSDREWETYQSYFTRVERESAQLRAVLGNLEAVAQERSWLRHQSSGELDDGKLVDGVAGERLVFKRRGVSDSPFQGPAGHQQQEPKRMLFVMDVSGSMYRFNGQDARLERMLETSLMIMESFAGFEKELDYCLMGHSGDSSEIPFVAFGAPPQDRKARLQVLQKMVAHTQYCRSGDHTVEAVERGVRRVAALEGDGRFVFVVSDANLERYGIRPRHLGRKLLAEPGVQAHALFIASFADEAERIRRDLPVGRGHVCLDTAELPRMFKQIFTAALGGS